MNHSNYRDFYGYLLNICFQIDNFSKLSDARALYKLKIVDIKTLVEEDHMDQAFTYLLLFTLFKIFEKIDKISSFDFNVFYFHT